MDDDLLRFHNGDTLHNIPVIREEHPANFPWRTVGAVAGVAALVGSVIGLAFGLGDRHHPSQSVAAATDTPTPAVTPSNVPSPSVITATATVQVPARTIYAAPTQGADSDGVNAEAVVEQYYNAVNAQEYQSAWELGGRNMSPSYDAFVSGYSDTMYDQVQVTSTDGDTVYVRVDATRYDGSTAAYTGSYVVDTAMHEISHGTLTQVG